MEFHVSSDTIYTQLKDWMELRAFLIKYQSSPISGNHSSKFNLFKCSYKQTAV